MRRVVITGAGTVNPLGQSLGQTLAALQAGRIAGAALDVTVDEPLPEASPLWTMPNVLITPHTGGETHKYEDNVLDMMMENLNRQWRGETALFNQIV